jgi:hypothetical protein
MVVKRIFGCRKRNGATVFPENRRPVAIWGHLARFRESDYHQGCFCSRAKQSLISCGVTFHIRSGDALFSELFLFSQLLTPQ